MRELFRLARLGKAVELRAILGELGRGNKVLQTRDYSGRSLVLTAAREGNVASVLALLEFGCDPSTPNNEGWTPLAFAARGAPKKERQPESWLQLAEALLRAKADMAATTSKGFQPLHYACASNHAAAVRVLLQRGANPSATTDVAGPPLDHVLVDPACPTSQSARASIVIGSACVEQSIKVCWCMH